MSEPRSSHVTPSPAPPPPEGPLAVPAPADVSSESSTQLNVAIPGLAQPHALLEEQVTIISNRGPMGDLPDPRPLAPLQVGRMLEGERLGQFVLQKFVGGGGMGAVFRALDTTLNREVAVKVLSRFQADEEETLRRFRNEAQSAARLDHDNIARVYYVGCDRGLHYIVFEYIEGENLRDLVERKGPLPVVEAISYTLQIAEALTHASQRDVIHRDIKPSNVIVTPDGKAKLVDMGLARLHQVDQPDQDITASGITLGTFDYISPEQAFDPRSADVRSDLYSLGCSVFFMLTGQPPFPHGTMLQKILRHQSDEPPDARTFRSDLPAELCRVMNRLLAKNPTDRYQQPGDLIVELVSLGRQLGMIAPTSVNVDWTLPSQPAVRPWERHLPWLLPLATLVVIVFVLDYVWRSPVDGGFWQGPAARRAESGHGDPRNAAGQPVPGQGRAARGEASAGIFTGRTAQPRLEATPIPNGTAPPAATGTAGRTGEVGAAQPGAGLPAGAPANAAAQLTTGGALAAPLTAGSAAARSGSMPAAAINPTGTVPMPVTETGLVRGAASTGENPGAPMPPGGAPNAGVPPGTSAANTTTGNMPPLATPLGTMPPGSMPPGPMPPTGMPPTGAAAAGPFPLTGQGGVSASVARPTTAEAGSDGGAVRGLGASRDDLLIVGDADERGNSFATLQAACSAAKSGDIVELRFSGVRDERPILLSSAKLTIRAGERYAPVVRFRPAETDPPKTSRSMIALAGGQLTLINVQLEMDLPRSAPDEPWALLALEQADSLRLERCVLTLRNAGIGQAAYHAGAAFLSLVAPAGAPSIMHDLQPEEEHAANVQLQNCIVRGEGTFLRDESRQGVHLAWDNGWLAVSDRLLVAGGAMQSRQGGPIDLDLRHVTAITRGGLALIDDDQMPMNLMPVEIKSADCVFATPALSGAPLVEQHTTDPANDYRGRLNWNGDRTWYQGFDVFWRVVDSTSGDPLQLSFSQWLAAWGEAHESLAHWGSVRWRTPPAADVPFAMQGPADYVLANDGVEGSPVGSASDGRDAGDILDLLPAARRLAVEPAGAAESP